MKKKVMLLGIVCLLLWGCLMKDPKMTPQEQVFLGKIENIATNFTVSKSNADVVWGRIQSFVGKYSSMRIQIVSEYVISTNKPTEAGEFGYTAVKTDLGDRVEFDITCTSGSFYVGKYANRNARILAYYAQLGEMVESLIKK